MKRILGGLILLFTMALPAFLGPAEVFVALLALSAVLCLFELYRATLQPSARILGWTGIIGALPFLTAIYFDQLATGSLILMATGLVIMALGLWLFEKERASGTEMALALSGLVYPLLLISCWIMIRMGVDGRFWMIFGLTCTFGSDTGAYYAGKNLGKHKLAPHLSPNKTVEGLIGGMATSVIGSLILITIYNHYWPLEGSYQLWAVGLIAAAITLLGLMGDLTASMFKREFGIKDMGNLIPGHGGMLDRMDGTIPVGAALYLILKVIA